MKELNQTDRIKIKLNLAKNTDSFLEVFGARSHKYRLDAPIGMNDVEVFEKKYNISLPEGYKDFLTKIGNGGNEYKSQVGNSGAGPDYGIFKLGDKGHSRIANPASGYLNKEPFFNSGTSHEEWKKIGENMPDDISDEDYDKEIERAYAGILTICACGCAGFAGIMLCGENRGRVVYIYDEIEYCPQFADEANFLDWYETWLDSIISGQRLKSRQPYGTEEEHFARYENVQETDMVQYWKIVALGYIRGFDSLSPEYADRLWKYYNIETDETVKLYILNLLAKFDYENAKADLDKLSVSNPVEFLKILHLYVPGKTSDWQSVIQKLQEESSTFEVTNYIKYVTTNDLGKWKR